MSQLENSPNRSSTDDFTPEHSQNATDAGSFISTGASLVPENVTSSIDSALTNWEVHLYGEIFQTIDQMVKLPEDDPLSLEAQVAHRAVNLLGFLKEQVRIDPPKIINQDGEALAFTWVDANLKRYLTVADDEVDLMHLSMDHPFRCEEVLSDNEKLPYREILERLSAETKSRSTDDEP